MVRVVFTYGRITKPNWGVRYLIPSVEQAVENTYQKAHQRQNGFFAAIFGV